MHEDKITINTKYTASENNPDTGLHFLQHCCLYYMEDSEILYTGCPKKSLYSSCTATF